MTEIICTYQRLSGESHRILALSEDEIFFAGMSRGHTEIKNHYTDNAEQGLSSIVTNVTRM